MKIPQLKRKLEVKKYHNFELKDEFSWIHQKDILEVLKDSSKLNSEVRKYLEEENAYTDYHLKNTKEIRIAGRNTQGVRIIKLTGDEKVVSAIKIDDNLL